MAERNQETYDLIKNKNLTMHPGKTAQDVPCLHLNSEQAVLSNPEGESSVMVSREDGTSIQGPLSIQTSPDQWRVAGMWKVNPLIMSSLPSTTYTPVPWMRQAPPRTPQTLIDGIVSMSALIAGLGL
jgi:hypothetical protein